MEGTQGEAGRCGKVIGACGRSKAWQIASKSVGPFGDFGVRAARDTGLLLEQPGQSKWAPLQRAQLLTFLWAGAKANHNMDG